MIELTCAWFQAFSVTWVIEMVVAWRLMPGPSKCRGALVVTWAQVTTHPLVWFVLPQVTTTRLGYLVLAETWAVLGELVVYRLAYPELSWRRAFAISALANGVSFGLGSLMQAFGWL